MLQEFQVNQVVRRHVESFLPSLFYEKNTLHHVIAWFLMLEKLLRLEFHCMCSYISLVILVSSSFSFQNWVEFFTIGGYDARQG